jgi:hypothetical protein
MSARKKSEIVKRYHVHALFWRSIEPKVESTIPELNPDGKHSAFLATGFLQSIKGALTDL